MNVTNRIAPAALLAAAFLVPSAARAQSNAGQFGGSAPGQFDPNAQPGAQPGTVPPGQFDPNAQPGQPGTARPGQFDPNAQPGVQPGTQPGTTTPGQFDPNAQYGGGAPPPAGPTDPNDPGASLDAAKEKDSGRGLTWFWLEAGGGFEHLGLQTIDDGGRSEDPCVQVVNEECATLAPDGDVDLSRTATGGMLDLGLGARLLFFTLGARGRLSILDRFTMLRVGPEVGLRIPIGSIEPRITLGGGYATIFDNPTTGGYVRVAGGLDYFVSTHFALGADLSGDLLVSDGADGDATDPQRVRQNAAASSDDEVTFDGTTGVGLGIALGLHVGLHL